MPPEAMEAVTARAGNCIRINYGTWEDIVAPMAFIQWAPAITVKLAGAKRRDTTQGQRGIINLEGVLAHHYESCHRTTRPPYIEGKVGPLQWTETENCKQSEKQC
jgi:hypothetical protein